MIHASNDKQRNAFSWWLRTGKLPPTTNSDGLELKFNPWHDPADGRFTFANSGRYHGAGGFGSGRNATGRTSVSVGRAIRSGDRNTLPAAPLSKTGAPQAGAQAKDRPSLAARRAVAIGARHVPASRTDDRPNPVTEFIGGVGQGLYGVGEAAVRGAVAVATTHPATTIRNAEQGIAGMIDGAIAAEDTPARVQVSRAAKAVANASARDIGRATGSIAGNAAVTIAPGAALSKVAALRRLRMARPRPTFAPPEIGWVKETIRSNKPWKLYNDTATGSRPGQAPTLMRKMPDGSMRPVKFDGIEGDYVIDRKWKIVDAPHGRAQLLRQSAVLAEHNLFGTWEVPTAVQKNKAIRFFKKNNVNNIKARVVKP